MPFDDGTADFRSDTVTRPTVAMRKAMASAIVGDDAYRDDPTVMELEQHVAELTALEAALFVPSGTMANQLAVLVHTSPGDEILAHEHSHVRNLQAGAAQALSGVAFRTVPSEDGAIGVADVERAMAGAGRLPPISMLLWENTHNLCGGRVVPIEVMEEASAAARRGGCGVHLDGARIFNAVAHSGVPLHRYAATSDTLQFCFSKGLGAPIGSIVCGTQDHVDEMRYLRRRLGGGMRQAGVIAAAARVALDERSRLHEDHELARYLSHGLAERFEDSTDPDSTETNIVQADAAAISSDWGPLVAQLDDRGLRVSPPSADIWRLVTHRDLDEVDVDRLLQALGEGS